ncbi:hypothetical protein ACH5RR_006450 [Cinchona calisaya]|uniref:Uncharacterized protein n=1 Tax=Cinchona calisaya TaxID=153742 RepID=A0ABD3AP29_9GENT
MESTPLKDNIFVATQVSTCFPSAQRMVSKWPIFQIGRQHYPGNFVIWDDYGFCEEFRARDRTGVGGVLAVDCEIMEFQG